MWGEGGAAYPWGDDWIDGVCNVPGTDGQATQAEELPAGSLPDCVSAFGVYDLVGNLWEWTDPGWDADVAAFLAATAARGAAVGADDAVSWGEDLSDLVMDVAGVDRSSLERGEDGILRARADPSTRPYTDRSALGFLVFSGDEVVGREDFLPIVVLPEGDPELPGPARLVVARELDARPLTDKRGCAWYVGGACSLDAAFYGHTHDFEGSIGVRCAADPY